MCVFTAAPTVIWGKSRAMHLPAKRHFLAITRVTTVEGQGFARMLRVPPRPTITQVKTIEKLNQDLGTDYPVPFTDKEAKLVRFDQCIASLKRRLNGLLGCDHRIG